MFSPAFPLNQGHLSGPDDSKCPSFETIKSKNWYK